MSLHGGLYMGQGRRLLASTAVVVLGLVIGASPSVAVDTVPTPPAADVTATDPAALPVVTDPAAVPTVTDPAAVPTVTDPAAVPTVTDPVVTDPVVTDPVVTDPVVTDPAGKSKPSTKPATTQLAPTLAPVLVPSNQTGGFEIDGNLTPATMDPPGLDWNSPELPLQPVADDGLLPGSDTTSFVASPGKSDVQYVYAYTHGDSAALWLDFAFTRPADTGSVAYELELNQHSGNTAGVPTRTPGDYMFRITQNGNGDFALNSVQQWTSAGWGADLGTSGVAAAANAAGSFFEIALNLTTLIGLQPNCPPSAVFTALNMRTHTSPSQSSALADYIAPITIEPPNNCPNLTLIKTVSGGTALRTDWTLTALADSTVPVAFRTVSGTTPVEGPVVPGKTYVLSESGPSGYAGTWSCVGGTFTAPDEVLLAAGHNATCTVNNVAQPAHLTLVKTVVNTHGGTAANTAWTLAAAGPTPFSGVTGTSAVTSVAVDAGVYNLSESGGPGGYGASGWECTAGSLVGAQLTLVLNQSATCTITNTDQSAHLTLVKTVSNFFGGLEPVSAWTLTATGPTTITGITGADAVTSAPVSAGSYTLSEVGPLGYAGTWSCSGGAFTDPDHVVLALGQDATCTISNVDLPAHLTLVKAVVNTHGGTAANTAWTLTATGPITISGHTTDSSVTSAAVSAGTYVLSEAGPGGYVGTWSCVGGTFTAGTPSAAAHVVLALSQSATCTVNNVAQPAHLTLVKTVSNVFGGIEPVSAWTLTATGPITISGHTTDSSVTSAAVSAGTYVLSEAGPGGYVGTWSCVGGTFTGPDQVALALGQDATCTVNNVAQPAHLTLVKSVVNTQGGSALNTAWTLTATGPTTITGITGADAVTAAAVSAGAYTLSESDGPASYSASEWACTAGSLVGAQLTLALNESATCTITNTFVQTVIADSPSISLDKLAILGDTNGNGKADAGETITYSFLVTNTGNVALTTVAVADPKLDLLAGFSAVTCSPTTLLPAASVTCTAAAYNVTDADVAAGLDVVNVATASGQPPTGSRVSDTDTVSTPTAMPEVLGVVENAPSILAFTGAATVPLGLSGLLALVLGAILTGASRRRQVGADRRGAHRPRE
ncbi:MAG: hypothetical protein HHJ11_11580 [Phycicoccus sp.]|nr:hypothetical protein [Phycicoccus sp.]